MARLRNNLSQQSLTFEVEEISFSAADGLALTDDDTGEHLLSKFGLTLLDRAEEHVSDGSSGEPVQARASVIARDHVHVFGTGVIGAVHY